VVEGTTKFFIYGFVLDIYLNKNDLSSVWMSVALAQLPSEFFETMDILLKRLEMINENIEKTEFLNLEMVELLKKTNELLQKMNEQLTENKMNTK
jgi:predicted transcriptional regulator